MRSSQVRNPLALTTAMLYLLSLLSGASAVALRERAEGCKYRSQSQDSISHRSHSAFTELRNLRQRDRRFSIRLGLRVSSLRHNLFFRRPHSPNNGQHTSWGIACSHRCFKWYHILKLHNPRGSLKLYLNKHNRARQLHMSHRPPGRQSQFRPILFPSKQPKRYSR